MNIKLEELVKNSNFRHYYFILSADEVKPNEVISVEIELTRKFSTTLDFEFSNIRETSTGKQYYDLLENSNMIFSLSADRCAWYLEKSKLFSFKTLEADFATETAYIHLTRKKG